MADPVVQGRVSLSTDTFTPTRNLLNATQWRDNYRQALKKLCAEATAPPAYQTFDQLHPNQDIPRQSAWGSLASTATALLARKRMPGLSTALNWGGAPVASGAANFWNPRQVAQEDPGDLTKINPKIDPRNEGTTNALWNAERAAQVATALPPAEAAAKGALLRKALLPYGMQSALSAGAQALSGGTKEDIASATIRSALPELAAQGAYRLVAPKLVGAPLAAVRGAGVAGLATAIPTAAMNMYDYKYNKDEGERKAMLRQESADASQRGFWGKAYQYPRMAGQFITGDLTGAANTSIGQEQESMEAAKMDAANDNRKVVPASDADPVQRAYTNDDARRWVSQTHTDMPGVPPQYVSSLVGNAFGDPRTLAHVNNVDGVMARVLRDAKHEGVTIPQERIPELRRNIQLQELQKPENKKAFESLQDNLEKLTGSQLTEKGANELSSLVANIGVNGTYAAIEKSMNTSLGQGGFLAKELGWFEPKGRFAPRDTSANDKAQAAMQQEAKARAVYRAAHPGGVRRIG